MEPAEQVMVTHSAWPFNMLRVRRTPEPDGEVVALVPMQQHQQLPPAAERHQWHVLEAESTGDFWKLAPGSKAALREVLDVDGERTNCTADKDYDEATQGWVVRLYDGHQTLEPLPQPIAAAAAAAAAAEPDAAVAIEEDEEEDEEEGGLVGAARLAAALLNSVKHSGGSLLILTGAGMSVSSGVPVFRGSDGSMSADFLRFLGGYNAARRRSGLAEADDWFSFSVPEMFAKATEKEAWAYWRWRTLRALVEPAEDYRTLNKLVEFFGTERTFVQSSNCDMLHERAGMPASRVHEIHGSLGRLQCAGPCCDALHPADDAFLERLRAEPDWVPRCPHCQVHCLRPNVMIFGDGQLVESALDGQSQNLAAFQEAVGPTRRGSGGEQNWAVLEIGAGVVVSSIRSKAELLASQGVGLVRINPSQEECDSMQLPHLQLAGTRRYHPLVARSNDALSALADELDL
jgi:NAD-dependent SIR2 family protein deacetylase